MKHVCYIYIKRYKILEDIGILLDSNYSIALNHETKVLHISKNDALPESFWGRGIYSIAGIFGNNGSGKSSTLSYLMSILVEGASIRQFDGLVVYEQDGKLYVYQNLSSGRVEVESNGIPCGKLSSLSKMQVFYYSGHFMPYLNVEDQRCQELAGLYNGSDAIRIQHDLQRYSNLDTFHMRHPLFLHLNGFVAQNNFRICMMLANPRVRETFDGFNLPEYVLYAPNTSGRSAWNEKSRTDSSMQLSTFKPLRFKDNRQNTLYKFVMLNIQNVINEVVAEDHDALILKWNEIANEKDDVLKQFRKYVNLWTVNIQAALKDVHYALSLIADNTHYCEDIGAFYLSFTEDADKVERISSAFKASHYLTSKIYDCYYSRELSSTNTILSSGEQEMLDLFSRMYDAVELSHKFASDLIAPRLLLLDEAEMGYHPEWQRKYLFILCKFVKTLMVVAGHDFQIIITSHSPLLLSDMPKSACNYLHKVGQHVINVTDSRPETFASNLYDLMNNNFFLTSYIGEFASSRIDNLIQRVNDAVDRNLTEDLQQLLREINLIGDSFIRGKLKEQLMPLAHIDEKTQLLLALEQKQEEYLELKRHYDSL